MWNPRYLKNLWTLTFFSRMKMLQRSAPGCFPIRNLNASRYTYPMQFILRQILLMQMRKMVSLSPSREYCRNPKSTSTLNLVCRVILPYMRFFPHCPAQQLGTFLIGVMILSTDRFQKIPLSRDILPDTKSLPSDSSSFLQLLSSGRAFITQLASLSLLIISRYLSKTESVMSRPLKTILSCSGFMNISPIYLSSALTELLGVSPTEIDFYYFVFIFSLTPDFRSFPNPPCFFPAFFLLALLPTLDWERLRFKFLSLWERLRLLLEWDLDNDWLSDRLFFNLFLLCFPIFFLDCLGLSLPFDRCGLTLLLLLRYTFGGDLLFSPCFFTPFIIQQKQSSWKAQASIGERGRIGGGKEGGGRRRGKEMKNQGRWEVGFLWAT